jgi:hypothetical protein
MADTDETPSECPVCHSTRAACILYGLPDFTPELEKELEEGRIVLGGCCIVGDDPKWRCIGCGHEWGHFEWSDPL